MFYIIISSILLKNFPFLAPKIYFKHDWLRINEIIQTSKGKIKNDTIYVGCSVGRQFLEFNYNNQLMSNGSVHPIGNYFLIKNAILNNRNIKHVVYFSLPEVIGNSISSAGTYNYLVKPFYNFDNRDIILSDTLVSSVLRRNNFLDLCLFDSYKILSIDDFNYLQDEVSLEFSKESYSWIKKIKYLCENNDVEFHLISPPVAKSKKDLYNNWQDIKTIVIGTELESLFKNYFSTINYFDDSFLKDHIHWNDKFIKENKNQIIMDLKGFK
tara:strand:+ start:283 stop:1089 length:807 start_codon:yes stop_codon:yes gene_type:complete